MSTTVATHNRISINDGHMREARDVVAHPIGGATLILRLSDGTEFVLPRSLQGVLFSALQQLAEVGQVALAQIPEELTSTAAADLLSISRPTLMKWVSDGRIASFKVGSHTRFRREDVIQLRSQRNRERMAAFQELRELEAEFDLLQ